MSLKSRGPTLSGPPKEQAYPRDYLNSLRSVISRRMAGAIEYCLWLKQALPHSLTKKYGVNATSVLFVALQWTLLQCNDDYTQYYKYLLIQMIFSFNEMSWLRW